MADTMTDHTGHAIAIHDPSWSACLDCTRWIDTRGAGQDARAMTGCYCPSDCGCKSDYRATICGCTGKHE